MENTDKTFKKKNGLTKPIDISSIIWEKNITIIDLSEKQIKELPDTIELPENVYELNLSHNLLVEVSNVVLKLKHLQKLNISHNSIIYFDDTPDFCHTIEQLDISNNSLNGPPYWVWLDSPKKLRQLNLSNNANLKQALTEEYLAELIQYTTLVTDVDVSNCRIGQDLNILKLFRGSKTFTAGISDFTYSKKNNLLELPNVGMEEYYDIEKLYICNTNIYTINSNIDKYKQLIVIDLSMNNITGFPKEFCNISNLAICILSFNKILYLPDEIHKLKKLRELHLNTNELCMIPESITKLCNLELLDLYDNHMSEVPEEMQNVQKLDLALNYFDEPTDEVYANKKAKLRLQSDRVDGRKAEIEISESETSSLSATEQDLNQVNDLREVTQRPISIHHTEIYHISQTMNSWFIQFDCVYCHKDTPSKNKKTFPDAAKDEEHSSSEDWDSDEYWIPQYYKLPTPPTSQWLCFIKEKMEEGNFCPIDMHIPSIVDRINEERRNYPREEHESEGQFDDYSGDDS